MNDICFYSGLPYTCNLCPEDSAPCFYMNEIRKLMNMEKKMKTDKQLISYISLWCGACNEKSPYEFNLCFRSKNENIPRWFYFESEMDMLKAKEYLNSNDCLVHTYDSRFESDHDIFGEFDDK